MNHEGLGLQGLASGEPLLVVEHRSDHSIPTGLRSSVGRGICRIACSAWAASHAPAVFVVTHGDL